LIWKGKKKSKNKNGLKIVFFFVGKFFKKKRGGAKIELFQVPTSPNWSKKLLAEALWVNLFFCKGFMVSNAKLKLDKIVLNLLNNNFYHNF
jgi:hypothetical protein